VGESPVFKPRLREIRREVCYYKKRGEVRGIDCHLKRKANSKGRETLQKKQKEKEKIMVKGGVGDKKKESTLFR